MPLNATALTAAEFKVYRESFIRTAYTQQTKTNVNRWLKIIERAFPVSDVIEYRKCGAQVVIRQSSAIILYDVSLGWPVRIASSEEEIIK